MQSKAKKKKGLLFSPGWKILFRYLLNYRKEMVVLSILGILFGVANAFGPYLLGSFFDALLGPSDIALLPNVVLPLWMAILIAWLILKLVSDLINWYNDRKGREIDSRLEALYLTNAASHLINLPVSFHKDHKQGATWDKVRRAAGAISQIVNWVVIQITPLLLSVVIGLVISFFVNPILATILTVGVLIFIFSLFKVVEPLLKLQRKGRKAWSTAYGDAHDAITNFQTIKNSGAEEYEAKKLNRNFLQRAFSQWFAVEKIWSNINFVQGITVTLTQLAIYAVSAFFVVNGSMTIGELVILSGYSMMVFRPFLRLAYQWQIIQNGIVDIERSEALLSLRTEYEDEHKKIIPKEIKGVVSFDSVSFGYSRKDGDVLKDLNMEITQGQVVAFVGESGVGKSTAIELISGYHFPTKGKVMVDGIDTKKISLKALRKGIAIVPQEVVLFNDTIKENIAYANPKASQADIEAAAKKAHAHEFIDKFPKKYKQVVGERGIKLSVGQKQRIAIARAILRDPKILILDEPTSALDPQTERLITDSLSDLMKGRTTFIIAHRLSTVRQANKIFVFEKGRIVESGSHKDLVKIKGGLYHKLYSLHVGLT